MDVKRYVIIVAGGSGTRMGGDVPKQFLPLCGQPILMHTLCCFHTFDPAVQIILVLPEAEIERWAELCQTHGFKIEHTIVKGGITRFHSVKNALEHVAGDGLVAVHDGVRPLVSHDTIRRCFDEAARTGAAIPVMECVESLRQLTNNASVAVDRSLYRMVQTPQIFRIDILQKAYSQPYLTHFTDDASVVEHAGHAVSLVEGNRENIKITTPLDLTIAELLLNK